MPAHVQPRLQNDAHHAVGERPLLHDGPPKHHDHRMNYREALDALGDDPHVWRYRELTDDAFHDPIVRDAWRARIVRMATGQPDPSPQDEKPPPTRVSTSVSESIRA